MLMENLLPVERGKKTAVPAGSELSWGGLKKLKLIHYNSCQLASYLSYNYSVKLLYIRIQKTENGCQHSNKDKLYSSIIIANVAGESSPRHQGKQITN